MSRHQTMFYRFLLSYLVILLIPILVGVYAYNRTVDVVRNDAAQLNLSVLEQSKDTMDRLFEETQDLVSRLSIDSQTQLLMETAKSPLTAESIYELAQLRTGLRKTVFNKLITDVHIYFDQSRYVVSPETVSSVSEMPLRFNNSPYGGWLRDMLGGSNRESRYISIEELTVYGQSRSGLVYVNPLPAGYSSKKEGAIVVYLNQRHITNMLERLVIGDHGFAYIQDSAGTIISSLHGEGGPWELLTLPKESANGYTFQTIHEQSMLVTYSTSAQNGWTYVAAFPSELVMEKAGYIKRITWTLVLLALLIGGLVALYLSYTNNKPLQELLISVKELDGIMKLQLPFLRRSFIERWLRGEFHSFEEWEAHAAQAQLNDQQTRYTAAVIRIHATNERGEVDTYAFDGARYDRSKLLTCCPEQEGHLHEIKRGKLVLVIPVEERLGVTEAAKDISCRLSKWQEHLRNELQLTTAIGVGSICDDPLLLCKSYQEAEQAVEGRLLENLHRVVWFQAMAGSSSSYYYPLDVELKLMNLVKTGDRNGLDLVLEQIEVQNVEYRQLSLSKKRQLLYEIRGTLYKLSDQPEGGTCPFREEVEALERLEEEGEFDFSHLASLARSMCKRMANQQQSKERVELFEEMKRMLNSGFTDSGLSLSVLADRFRLSESAASVFFKDQSGIPFSDYLEQLRLEKACCLLMETTLPIQEIAVQVGYNSDKAFRRAFKRVVGIQPTSYRKTIRAVEH
ncbi:helix-turn-helix domain-containing protein [Paenibacillus sp. GD4]|uniref:helix-turn-helix domain-containing protein n=1 Tax=Paenibacillus sp. GD4 TaxID=3068890 RepID=UPI0027964FC8|nr:helix-turn-helix domain-containing protein [Paenibacillus sp. GD4]MDQ1913632.1 helix-turn-helix domain-containing protein [Paenibacillus sp. GD4]